MTALNGVTQPGAIRKCHLSSAGRVHAGEKASLFGASASVDGVRETGLLEREEDYS